MMKKLSYKHYNKGWYTYDVHENCLIFKTPIPTVHLLPKYVRVHLHPLDFGRPILNEHAPLYFLQQTMEQQLHHACE